LALIDVDGTISGTGTATGGVTMIIGAGASAVGSAAVSGPVEATVELDDILSGSGAATASPEYIYIFSGTAKGSGVLIDDTLGLMAGSAVGISAVTGDIIRVRQISGYIQGKGTFAVSAPEPIYGVATVTAFMEVICHPAPFECPTVPVATFNWGQMFQKPDLYISVTDNLCNAIGPVCISYTLYRVVRGCQLHQVGCADRVPATCKVGTYYVTGCAGEGGQPGLWVVRWKYQRSFADPVIEKDMCYQVLDGVLAGDTAGRECKYGWD